MKSKIVYSGYSRGLTLVLTAAMLVICIIAFKEVVAFVILLSILLVLWLSSLLYGPWYIDVTPDYIIMGSLLRRKKLLMRDVESVQLFQPTMGALRLWASGGFMGYWGIFMEKDVGRYYAFYGKSSECFLVRMKNGDKYVLGCADPVKMVDYISGHLSK